MLSGWQERQYHGILSNHLAVSSLHVVGNLLDSSSLLYHRDVYLKHIFDHQSKKEGWLMEYDGADPYQSHALFT